MTEFIDFPHVTITLPEDGKVTGSVVLVVRGSTAMVLTSRGVGPGGVTYRGKEYRVTRLELVRQEGGGVTLAEDEKDQYAYSRIGGNYDDYAPRTYYPVITSALIAAVEEVWTVALMAEGKIAKASQAIHRLDRQRRELSEQLTALVDEQISYQRDFDEASMVLAGRS